MLLGLYRALTGFLAIPVADYHLSSRIRKGKEIAERLDERKGKTKSDAHMLSRKEPVIWIHAASVGESLSVLVLIKRLLERCPSCFILLTTGTVTSASLLKKKLPVRVFHQFVPFDVRPWVKAFLDHWRPSLALWVESEIWPNLIWETTNRKIPLVMINGRMSEKSFKKWRWAKSLIQPLMGRFSLCFAQSSEDAHRLRLLGATKVIHAGNLKAAAEPLECDNEELQRIGHRVGMRPTWLAASTHDPEEEIIVQAHHLLKKKFPDLLTILVPRHPHRGAALREKFDQELCLAQRSLGEIISDKTDFYLADTLGELGLFYRLSPIAFIGGSLTPIGGHNLIEPAHFGSAILHGPYMTNSREITALFRKENAAIEVTSAETLALHVEKLLTFPEQREEMVNAAWKIVQAQSQVVEKVVEGLEEFLENFEKKVFP